MDESRLTHYATFDRPATYRIVVEGKLAPRLSDRLEGMAIDTTTAEDGTPTSVLTGVLADQSALISVLHALYEFHCSLALVELLPPSAHPASRSDPFLEERAG